MYFLMIEYSYDVIELSIFVIYDVQYVPIAYGSKINWIFIFANHKWTTHILNALIFMFSKFCFIKMCDFVNYFSNLIYMYFHQGLKKFNVQKMIYHHFHLNLSKVEIFCLLVFGDIVMKMDNFYLFEEVLIFLFHT